MARLFLTLFALCQLVQLSAQSTTDSLTFSELLEYLREEHSLQFSYDSDLEVDGMFWISDDASSLRDELSDIWSEAHIDSRYVAEDHILLRTKRIPIQSIRHRFSVIDQTSGDALEMVSISGLGTQVSTYSDVKGGASLFFQSDALPDSIVCHLLGYETIVLPLRDPSQMHVIKMTPLAIGIDEVVIVERIPPINYQSTDGAMIIRSSSSTELIGTLGEPDILRRIQLLPGISAHSDKSAGIRIRGGDADQTLIILDEMPLYNAYHYYGIYSAINDSYIDQTKIYKNTVPAEYGQTSNGMVQMTSPTETHGFSGMVRLSTLSSAASIRADVSEYLSLQGSGRISYQNIYNSEINEQQDIITRSQGSLLRSAPDFSFYDWNAKAIISPSIGHTINLSAYRSSDQFEDIYSYVQTPRRQRIKRLEEKYSNTEKWNNRSYSITHSSRLSDTWSWYNAYHSTEYNNANDQSLSLQLNIGNDIASRSRAHNQENSIVDQGIKSKMIYHNPDSVVMASVGGEYLSYTSQLDVSRDTRQNDLKVDAQAHVYGAFGSIELRNYKGWSATAGVRMDHLSTTGKPYISPRITIVHRPRSGLQLKSSLSRQFQFLREFQIENANGRSLSVWSIANQERIPVIRVDHIMAGIHYNYDRWAIDVEAYYNTTKGVLEYAFATTPVDDQRRFMPGATFQLYRGDGLTRGIDVLLTYSGIKYDTWLSYTLSKSTNSFTKVARGADFPSQSDRRHQLKWVHTYTHGPWTLSTNWIYSTGRPYTDITKLTADRSRENINPQDRISRLSPYIRQDIGVQYTTKLMDQKLTLGLSVFNLWNRNNVDYIQYIYSINAQAIGRQGRNGNVVVGTETPMLGRIVSGVVSFSF